MLSSVADPLKTTNVIPISGVIQKYAWGKHGNDSEVARLHKGSVNSFDIQSNTPYAELWFGTHPKGTSSLIGSNEPLTLWLSKNSVANEESTELPFLFKILSVESALSIQIHPNKLEAIKLHEKNPKEYPDSNHKPEMAIALTPFEALCGFRPLVEIHSYIQKLEELQLLTNTKSQIGSIEYCNNDFSFKEAFISLMNSNKDLVEELSTKLNEKIEKNDSMKSDANHKLFSRLYTQYPGDVGCFCVYFLNYIMLQPGQSLFLQSNLPHAYIHGDCIECMACSDNVIRAGLTPKYRDVDSLCRLVDYTCKQISDVLFEPVKHPNDQHITIYKPPVPEFAVEKINLPPNFNSYVLPSVETSSILIVICGRADVKLDGDENILNANRGTTLFIGANESVQFVQCNSDDAVIMFRAFSQI